MEIESAWKFKLGFLHGGGVIRGVVLRILIVWVHLVDDKELGICRIGCRNSPRVLSSSSTCMIYESPQLKQFPKNTFCPSMNLSRCARWKQIVRSKPLQQSLVLARLCMWASTFLWSSKSPRPCWTQTCTQNLLTISLKFQAPNNARAPFLCTPTRLRNRGSTESQQNGTDCFVFWGSNQDRRMDALALVSRFHANKIKLEQMKDKGLQVMTILF